MSSVQLKRGTSSQWFSKNPILKNGELGVELDTKRMKLGNGTTRWNSLNYITVVPADLANTIGSYIPEEEKGISGGVATLNSSGVIPDSQIPSGIARDTEIITSYNDLDDVPTLFSGSYTDLTEKPTLFSGSYDDLSNKPTIPSLTGYATETYVETAVSNLVDSAPGTLNTLNEIAAAINDDASYAATITTALGTKVSINGTETLLNKTLIDPELTVNANIITLNYESLSPNTGIWATSATSISNQSDMTISTATSLIIENSTGGLNDGVYPISVSGSTITLQSPGLPDVNGFNNPGAGPSFTFSGPVNISSIEIGYLNNVSSPIQTQINNINGEISKIDAKSDKIISISSKSESYVVQDTDLGKLIEMSGGGTVTITDSSSFAIGFSVDVVQTGSSQVTIAGTSFTPNATPGLKLRAQWSSATLIKRALNSWVVLGDLSA
jgi:hypothetical protein